MGREAGKTCGRSRKSAVATIPLGIEGAVGELGDAPEAIVADLLIELLEERIDLEK
jgi:hypothetical protein